MTLPAPDIQTPAAVPSAAARPWPVARAYLVALVLVAALYGLTAQRGAAWQDSGYHQLRALRVQWENPLGLALSHPLLIAAAQPLKVFGAANLPWAMNLLSSLAMAVAVANVLLLSYRLTARPAAAMLAAAALTVCHTAWWLGTITETYPLTAAALTTELLLLLAMLRRPRARHLLLLALVNGLGLSLHNFALLPLPVYAVTATVLVVRRRLPAWALPAAAMIWLAGASPLLALIVREIQTTGDVGAAVRSALFGRVWQQAVMGVSPGALARTVAMGVGYILLNWPFLSLAPAALGWAAMARRAGRSVAAAMGAVAGIHLLFAIRYRVPDQFMFLLPFYTLLAVGWAVGIDCLLGWRPRARRAALALVGASLVLTPVLYAVLPGILVRTGHPLRGSYHLPERDESRYWLSPWKHNEASAERFARRALRAAGPDGIILASGTIGPPVQVVQTVEPELAPRVHVETMIEPRLGLIEPVNEAVIKDRDRILHIAGGRPLYVVADNPNPVIDASLRARRLPTAYEALVRLALPSDGATAGGEND